MPEKSKVKLYRSTLRALSLFVSDDTFRPELMGVHVENRDKDKEDKCVVVATNGHTLVVLQLRGDESFDGDSLWIPPEIMDEHKSCRQSQHWELIEIEAEIDYEKNISTIKATDIAGRFVGINEYQPCDFPRWRSVLPDKLAGEVAQFNPDYLALFKRAKEYLTNDYGSPSIYVRHNKPNRAAVVDLDLPYFYGLVMPIIDDTGRTIIIPDFLN